MVPGRRRSLQRGDKSGRWSNRALLVVQRNLNIECFPTLQPGCFTIASTQWNAHGPAHGRDGGPICVAVQRYPNWRSDFAKQRLWVEGYRDKAHASIANNPNADGLGSHHGAPMRRLTLRCAAGGCGKRTNVRCSARVRVHRHVRRRYFARRAASKATPTMTSTTPNIAMAAMSSTV